MENSRKTGILEALKKRRNAFSGSDAKFATSININASQLSRIMSGELEMVLSDAKWNELAARIGYTENAEHVATAETPVFTFICSQLDLCRQTSISAILCDIPDIGKTYAAKHYAANNPNTVYVDCSLTRTRTRTVSEIARGMGIQTDGYYLGVFKKVIDHIRSGEKILIILDEAGDLEYEAFKEIKALWNATEYCCGWYMMGADGLREKIMRGIKSVAVGYAEMISRFGGRFIRVIPEGALYRKEILTRAAIDILSANVDKSSIDALLEKSLLDDGVPSLRRIRREIIKHKSCTI